MKTATQILSSYLRARYSLLAVRSPEEERTIQDIMTVAEKSGREVYLWSITRGLYPASKLAAVKVDSKDSKFNESSKDPVNGLFDSIFSAKDMKALFILLDFNPYLTDPRVARRLREASLALSRTTIREAKTIILLSADAKLPDSMPNEGATIDWPLPDRERLTMQLESFVGAVEEEKRPNISGEGLNEIIDASMGLTVQESINVWSRCLVDQRTLEPKQIASEKRQVISRTGLLQWVDSEFTMANVGGLEGLKDWMVARRPIFTQEARDYGIPAPKGVLLVGVPGGGKSLMAKVASNTLGLPLVRLDVGALFGGLVGQSEENTRAVLKTLSAIAPCICWIN